MVAIEDSGTMGNVAKCLNGLYHVKDQSPNGNGFHQMLLYFVELLLSGSMH